VCSAVVTRNKDVIVIAAVAFASLTLQQELQLLLMVGNCCQRVVFHPKDAQSHGHSETRDKEQETRETPESLGYSRRTHHI